MKGKAADYHMLVRMIREMKVPRDRFRCVLVVFLYVTKPVARNFNLPNHGLPDSRRRNTRYEKTKNPQLVAQHCFAARFGAIDVSRFSPCVINLS